MLDDWCDVCDLKLPCELLKPRYVLNELGFSVPVGFVCLDEVECRAYVEARELLNAERSRKAEEYAARGIG